jgi:hypothetical protein
MFKKLFSSSAVILLVIGLCFAIPQSSYSATVINIDASAVALDIGAFEATITSAATIEANFTANFPTGWFDFSADKLISAFDGASVGSLPAGPIGSFDINTGLTGWELTNQAGTVLTLGSDYFVRNPGGTTNYNVVVPIPGSILLLGSGLVGLIGIARRKMS